ncbi:glutamine-hydrolyzing carbamoyl-phosphate synthase small subunit [Candidatus Uhrbacteria bacterium]|nr:glutamine-hydrolyzing carbamoyl-phosphate synthase small subunit [Candidatus Uhrbacteria bacterium]
MRINTVLKKQKNDVDYQGHPQGDVFFNTAYLRLKSGLVLQGRAPEWQRGISQGEVVFTTGMTGYVETLTDPSYTGQIIVFTYPLVGNYGVPDPRYWESKKIHAAGAVFSHISTIWSHAQGQHSLEEWLKKQHVPFLTHVDTRTLTLHVRKQGCTPGIIDCEGGETHISFDSQDNNPVSQVSVPKKQTAGKGTKKIIAVDCGMKEGIMTELLSFDTTVMRVPHDYDYTRDEYHGIFISNGPGDPQMAQSTITILKKALKQKKPIFGICLGSQLLALAAGAKTYKLPYGHRGHNQPCKNMLDGTCVMTSQNHGYAVDEKTLPKAWRVTYRNLNDMTVEGVAHATRPFFSVQFHPEGRPGPVDSRSLFDDFYSLL